MIRITLSTDLRGFGPNATLLASILRRTEAPVHVRCWCRGFLPESFEQGTLRVEFIRADEEVTGRYPGHVPEAVFDRLRVIRDCADWDRCLVMDQDMVVFCDLAPYFAEDFEGNLLMGRLFGPGNTLGLQMRARGGLPEGWKHAENHPYFYMGPMMNLAAMREEGLWETLLHAHGDIGQDEQLSLTAACGGRVKGVGKRWNLVPQWDRLAERDAPEEDRGAADPVSALGGEIWDGLGIPWVNGVPAGVIHWTGPSKPWHRGAKIWRPDVWEGERTSWEALRLGLWEKPLAVEVEPQDGFGVRALARRGWRVRVASRKFGQVAVGRRRIDGRDVDFPDVVKETGVAGVVEPEVVRFGAGAFDERVLDSFSEPPSDVVLRGPADVEALGKLRKRGYIGETRLQTIDWPTGGPSPSVLEFEMDLPSMAVGSGEEAYLTRRAANGNGGVRMTTHPADDESGIGPGSEHGLGSEAWNVTLGGLPAGFTPDRIVVLGWGPVVLLLHNRFPQARIQVIEYDSLWFMRGKERAAEVAQIAMVHLSMDGSLPWFDAGPMEWSEMDLLVVTDRGDRRAEDIRRGAPGLRRYLRSGARVLIGGASDGCDSVDTWLATGGMRLVDGLEGVRELELVVDGPPSQVWRPVEIKSISDVAERTWVISLPERGDRREALARNWEEAGMRMEWLDGVRPEREEIRWAEMKGMEAYGKDGNLRNDYVVGAVGCKRAGIEALGTFIDSGAATGLICQDDCHWKPGAQEIVVRAFRELPADWDMVYFSASARERHEPFSPHLVRLRGARLCTAILWKRATAIRLLPELEVCDTEWDLFMERSHSRIKAYCVVPMPAFQARSHSDIVGGVVQPANR